jgi:sugar phosphate isomerase/epimerase
MVKTAIQLYTLRDVDEPLPRLLERVGETSFDGVEFAFRVAEADRAAVTDALDRAGIEASGWLAGEDALAEEAAMDETVELADAIGVDRIGLAWLDPEHFETADAVAETAALLTDLGDRLADRGVEFYYHNHDQEFVDVGGETAYDRLVDEVGDSVSFELDCGWALVGGRDPVDLLDRLAGRAPLVHLKDVDADHGVPVEVGNGDLDLEACAAAAREAGADWLVYEHDYPDFPLRSLEHAAETFDRLRD